MGKGGGESQQSSTQTIQKADPWSGLVPFLTGYGGSGGTPGTAGHWEPNDPNMTSGWSLTDALYHQPTIDSSNGHWVPGSEGTAGSGGFPGLFPAAANWYNSSNPQYYPGQTVAQPNQTFWDTLQQQENRGRAGSPEVNNAKSLVNATNRGDFMNNEATHNLGNVFNSLQNTANGSMLNANPYVNAMFNQAAGQVGNQYKNTVMPQLASMYSAAGRYGSNAMNQATDTAQNNFGNTLNKLGTDIYGQNYANERQLQQQAAGLQTAAANAQGNLFSNERGRMMQSAALAPMLAQNDYTDLSKVLESANMKQALNQQNINADIAKWNFNQNQPLQKLQSLSNILQGFGGGSSTSNSTGTVPGQPSSPLSGALGGASLASSIGSAIPGMMMGTLGEGGAMQLGATVGGPWGMLAGAVLGGLFS